MIYKKLGDCVQLVAKRNSDDSVQNVVGINIAKYFMPSVANIIDTDLTKYKVIKKGQFACNRMHVGRDNSLPVAMYINEQEAIVSPAYDVFEVKNLEEILPEYLLLFFSRSEFDRECWFHTDADVRGSLSWADLTNIRMPVPSIEEQKEIIRKYKVITDRIKVLTDINQKLEETSNILYQDFMKKIKCDDVSIFDVATIKYGKGLQKQDLTQSGYHVFGGNGIIGYYTDYLYEEPQILISCRGAASGNILESLPYSYVTSNSLIVELANRRYYEFIKRFLILHPLHAYTTGSAQPQITIDNLAPLKLPYPKESDIDQINQKLQPIADYKLKIVMELQKLTELKDVLLPKLMTGDIN